VKLEEVNLVEYNFPAAGAARNAMVERFDTEVAPEPAE
jgi:hypothetical protein